MYALIGILVPLVMSVLNRSARKKVEAVDGTVISLRLNKFYLIASLAMIGIALIFSFFILTDETETDPITLLVFIWLFSLLLILPPLFWYTNHRVNFDEEQIFSSNWSGRKTTIEWQEISEAKFNAMAGYLVLKGNGKTAKVHQHLVGLKSLTDMMEKKTKWTAKELGLPFK